MKITANYLPPHLAPPQSAPTPCITVTLSKEEHREAIFAYIGRCKVGAAGRGVREIKHHSVADGGHVEVILGGDSWLNLTPAPFGE